MHHFAKTQTSYDSCSKNSLPFRKFLVTTTNPLEVFHLFKINDPQKFRGVAFIRKYKTFQSSNAT